MDKVTIKKIMYSVILSSMITSSIYRLLEDEKITDYNILYETNDDEYKPFGYINDRSIYICNIDEQTNYENIIDDNDVLVIDFRGEEIPHYKVINSYKIYNLNEISTIVDILIDYEIKYPSDFYRTKDSMINEWVIHNYFYNNNLFVNSTKDVDLDNNTENICKYVNFVRKLTK